MKLPVTLALASTVGRGSGYSPTHPATRPRTAITKIIMTTTMNANVTKKPSITQGKSGVVYVRDYGISSGRCNRDEIGAVIGGVTGAVIGSQVADREDRVVGMVVGGVLGAVLGHAIGDSMDDRDRACMGHALELGRPGVPVEWRHDGHLTTSRRAATPAAVAATPPGD